jgi:single-strand DNA-binding protein
MGGQSQGNWGQQQGMQSQQPMNQARPAQTPQQNMQQQGGYARPAQQPQSAPPVYNEPPMDFDDDIPF